MAYASSSDMDSPASSTSRQASTNPSSPPVEPEDEEMAETMKSGEELEMERREEEARLANEKAETARIKRLAARRKRSKNETREEREAKSRQLDELLSKSAAFSEILTKKTEVLGQVGVGFDGKALGEHDLKMAKQPKCMVGGIMREYQLEGLTWMYEICSQGMSGILADEMGLGKTVQTISLIALLREQEGYLGPHLIVAPLSTLSNWIEEFEKWVPSVPVVLYHGDRARREELRQTRIMKHLEKGRPTNKFPVLCTSYEMILQDRAHLSKINWEFIIIDEGHRMKNFDSRLFRELRTFTSATRLLITGTPLQNNLKELWSLLNFLLPDIFRSWEAFESWFDFSDLQDEQGTQQFIEDQKKQDLVKKMHLILQPLLLRRIKADVEHMLPKKREYVLYAPMTKDQVELYDIISKKDTDVRKFLENKVIERLNQAAEARKAVMRSKSRPTRSHASMALRGRKTNEEPAKSKGSTNAFQMMMGRSSSVPISSLKRKTDNTSASSNKSAKSSRQSTPASSIRSRRQRVSYKEAAEDEDQMSDDEFEAKLAAELDAKSLSSSEDEVDSRQTQIEKLARREISTKKLGNPVMQLRLVCNSPHNFFNPWSADSEMPIDESLVTASGKMLLLDRLLPHLFDRGHKVLIFSQFKVQLDLIEDYARELRDWPVCRIDGSVQQVSRRDQIKLFNEDPEYKLFLLSTRAGGQGINLASADTVILFDSDWNPQQDLQAQDRAHRIGQKNPVIVYRLATKGTVEEDLLLNADAKRRLEKLVIKKGGFRTMGQKMNRSEEDMDIEALRTLLLRDGEVYEYTGKKEILSDADLEVLCDRSEEAYTAAEKGLGDRDGFKVVDTKANGLTDIQMT